MGNREKLLEIAAERFARNGYRATSVDDILKAAAVAPSNFYYHFPSKEALASEVLERYFDCARKETAPLLANRRLRAREKLEQMFALFTRRLAESDCCVGCPMSHLAQELSDTHPGFREKIAEFFEEWTEGLEAAVRQGVRDGELRADLDPRAAACLVVGLIQGLVLLSRNTRNLDAANKGFRQALILLGKP